MSAREAKAAAEVSQRVKAKEHADMIGAMGKSRKAAATPATARKLAVETRALAKVFPQEARVVAKELRADAKHMTAMQERMKRQAPPARIIPAPPPTAVVARAAAKNPAPVSMADIKKFFGVTIPKPAVAAMTPEAFFGGAKVTPAAAAEVPFSSSSSSGGAKAATSAEQLKLAHLFGKAAEESFAARLAANPVSRDRRIAIVKEFNDYLAGRDVQKDAASNFYYPFEQYFMRSSKPIDILKGIEDRLTDNGFLRGESEIMFAKNLVKRMKTKNSKGVMIDYVEELFKNPDA